MQATGSEGNKKRHALYKSRMAELAHYRKLLQGQQSSSEIQTSKHIDKYNHKQKHMKNLEANNMIDPDVQQQFNHLVKAMATQMYQEMKVNPKGQNQDTAKNQLKDDSRSFTLQKFYEQNKEEILTAVEKQKNCAAQEGNRSGSPSGSDDFETTAGQSLPKREPVQVSSEEIDEGTELE